MTREQLIERAQAYTLKNDECIRALMDAIKDRPEGAAPPPEWCALLREVMDRREVENDMWEEAGGRPK
jgi:hypothetical protein